MQSTLEGFGVLRMSLHESSYTTMYTFRVMRAHEINMDKLSIIRLLPLISFTVKVLGAGLNRIALTSSCFNSKN